MVLVLWAFPVAGRLLVEVNHVQIAPFVLWLTMGMIWRRVTRPEGGLRFPFGKFRWL